MNDYHEERSEWTEAYLCLYSGQRRPVLHFSVGIQQVNQTLLIINVFFQERGDEDRLLNFS